MGYRGILAKFGLGKAETPPTPEGNCDANLILAMSDLLEYGHPVAVADRYLSIPNVVMPLELDHQPRSLALYGFSETSFLAVVFTRPFKLYNLDQIDERHAHLSITQYSRIDKPLCVGREPLPGERDELEQILLSAADSILD